MATGTDSLPCRHIKMARVRPLLPVQIPSQQSFDPLAQPDLLAAFTQVKEPSGGWMSFDDNETASGAGPFQQSSMASSAFDSKSLGAAEPDQVTQWDPDVFRLLRIRKCCVLRLCSHPGG